MCVFVCISVWGLGGYRRGALVWNGLKINKKATFFFIILTVFRNWIAGGRNCSYLGPSIEVLKCNKKPCPIHGGFERWSKFGECNVSCGGGVQKRVRYCNEPVPKYGGIIITIFSFIKDNWQCILTAIFFKEMIFPSLC